MPDHVAQQALDEFQRRLEWLQSVRAGYTTVLLDVHQPVPYEENPDAEKHLHCDVVLLNPERNESLDSAGNPPFVGWTQGILAGVTFSPSDDQTDSVDKLSNRIVKDTIRAIFQDPDNAGVYEHTLGGIVVGMDILAPEFIDASEQGPDLIQVGVQVHYITRENDPSNQS